MMINWVRSARLIAILGALLVVACGAAACGSDSSSDDTTNVSVESENGESSQEVAANALKVAEEYTSVEKIGPTKPIQGEIPTDKTLVYVNCGSPACASQSISFKEAAAVLGWKVEDVMAEPTPEAIQAAFDEAIRRKPDGVASAGFGPALYPKQLAELEKMEVPVFESTGEVNSGEGIEYDPVGPKQTEEAMQILAHKTVADMEGEGEAGAILLTGYPIVADYTNAWSKEVENLCSKCSVETMEIQNTSIGKDSPELIANFVRAHPDVKALFISYDILASGLPAALKNIGLKQPLTYSWGVDAPGIVALQTGERTASVPLPYNEVPWQLIDGFARYFAGEDPVEPFQKPIIWSKEFGTVPDQTDPYPAIVPDYKGQFEALWGLK